MINTALIKKLANSKNLLAFSAGVDSTALFFILKEKNIPFDIAIVDYNLREQSKAEVAYAKELALKYKKKVYIKSAPKFSSNFEANARDFRYNFFKEITKEHSYNNLLTAHQLNDKLEWLLMRLSKGAGVTTLSGMQELEQRENHTIVRPLLHLTKDELTKFLDTNSIKYFIDKSNFSNKYERNKIRPLSNKLLELGKDGFNRSFKLLQEESKIIKSGYKLKYKAKELRVVELESIKYAPYALNYYLKDLGYLVSYKEQELIKKEKSIVIGRAWVAEIVDNLLYISPYIKVVMPKEVRENYRKLKIPPKVRGYLFKELKQYEQVLSILLLYFISGAIKS